MSLPKIGASTSSMSTTSVSSTPPSSVALSSASLMSQAGLLGSSLTAAPKSLSARAIHQDTSIAQLRRRAQRAIITAEQAIDSKDLAQARRDYKSADDYISQIEDAGDAADDLHSRLNELFARLSVSAKPLAGPSAAVLPSQSSISHPTPYAASPAQHPKTKQKASLVKVEQALPKAGKSVRAVPPTTVTNYFKRLDGRNDLLKKILSFVATPYAIAQMASVDKQWHQALTDTKRSPEISEVLLLHAKAIKPISEQPAVSLAKSLYLESMRESVTSYGKRRGQMQRLKSLYRRVPLDPWSITQERAGLGMWKNHSVSQIREAAELLYKAGYRHLNASFIEQEHKAIWDSPICDSDKPAIVQVLYEVGSAYVNPGLIAQERAAILTKIRGYETMRELSRLYLLVYKHLSTAVIAQERAAIRTSVHSNWIKTKAVSALYEAGKRRLDLDLINQESTSILTSRVLPDEDQLQALKHLYLVGQSQFNLAFIKQQRRAISGSRMSREFANKAIEALHQVGESHLNQELSVQERSSMQAAATAILTAAVADRKKVAELSQLYCNAIAYLNAAFIAQERAAIWASTLSEPNKALLVAILYRLGHAYLNDDLIDDELTAIETSAMEAGDKTSALRDFESVTNERMEATDYDRTKSAALSFLKRQEFSFLSPPPSPSFPLAL